MTEVVQRMIVLPVRVRPAREYHHHTMNQAPELPAVPALPRWAVVAASAATAILVFFGTGLHPVWWLAWFAPVPVLAIAPRLRARSAFLAAAIAWAAGGLNLWSYLHGVIGVPAGVTLGALLLPAIVFGAAVLAFRGLTGRGRPGRAMLVLPALWVAYEYAWTTLSPHGTFGLIAYSQMDWLPIAQIAAVTGAWGIGFCLFLFASTIAALVSSRERRRAVVPAAAALVALASVVAWGAKRTTSSRDPAATGRPVAIALMAADAPEYPFPATDEASLALYRRYAGQAAQIAGRLHASGPAGTDAVIVLPEKIGAVSDVATAVVDDLMRQAATTAGATIVAGLDRGDSTSRRNEARMYAPSGDRPIVYDKHHLIPGLEAIDRPGTSRVVLERSSGRWGIEICKDMDFAPLARAYAGNGADLLLVPAWDFDVDGWLHSRMAMLRGIEGGFAIARAARHGRLTVTDARGRVVAEASSAGPAFSTLVAGVRIAHEPTLYTRFGDWFAWLCVAMVVVLALREAVFSARARPSRSGRSAPSPR
jgi:apolipoprotein N-acyltransferase